MESVYKFSFKLCLACSVYQQIQDPKNFNSLIKKNINETIIRNT